MSGASQSRSASVTYLLAERDGDVRAWEYIDPDYAIEQARNADRERASGKAVGPLHGVTVGIKDIIDTADMPTENGSALISRLTRPVPEPVLASRWPAACAALLAHLAAQKLGQMAGDGGIGDIRQS